MIDDLKPHTQYEFTVKVVKVYFLHVAKPVFMLPFVLLFTYKLLNCTYKLFPLPLGTKAEPMEHGCVKYNI